MSYNFGQMRRPQIKSYSMKLDYSLDMISEQSPLSEAVVFNEKVINLTGSNVLQYADSSGVKRRYYYLRFKVYKMLDTPQTITVKLINTLKAVDNKQTLTTVTVDKGDENDYSIYELVIAPNSNYDRIELTLNRIVDDYSVIHEDGTYGRVINVEIDRLEEMYNVIDYLKSATNNATMLKQIGVQGPPGLLMCIDGEGIKIGRSGMYEIKNGVTISFIGFVVEPDDNKYFMLDYQY